MPLAHISNLKYTKFINLLKLTIRNNAKIKIVFILPNLLPGGAERVFSIISQNIDKTKFKVTLLVIGYSKDASYEIKDIKLHFLEKPRVSKGVFALIKFLTKNKPDVVMTANGHLNTLVGYLTFLYPKTFFISREVTILTEMSNTYSSNSFKSKILGYLNRKRYALFDKVICQSEDMKNDFIDNYNIQPEKLVVINNPISNSFKLKTEHNLNEVKKFITIGRLSKEKGHLRLINILAKLDFPFLYIIIGDGPEKNKIFNQINNLGLENNISHISFTKEIQKFLSESDMFLQGSYYEGFPNALLESCAVGTPVLAFNAPGGTKEIIENDVNGFMVSTESEFLNILSENKTWNPKIVRESVISRFESSKILNQYEELIQNVFNQKAK